MSLPAASDENAEQIAYWNGSAGMCWLDRQQAQDTLFAPISDVLLDRAHAQEGEVALDIGCGCGATSLELAQHVAPTGHVLGIDVSAPMLERARHRAPMGLPVEFALGDATIYQFAPGQADLLCSRFGVMFFADPARSFANMRQGLRTGARLCFACWRSPRENPWLIMPLQEAYRHVPRMPELGPEDPGPFAFASKDRVRRILEQAGFSAIGFEPVDLLLDLANDLGLEAAVETAVDIGPTSRALNGQPPELRAAATESIRIALARHQVGQAVPLQSAIWIVSASTS